MPLPVPPTSTCMELSLCQWRNQPDCHDQYGHCQLQHARHDRWYILTVMFSAVLDCMQLVNARLWSSTNCCQASLQGRNCCFQQELHVLLHQAWRQAILTQCKLGVACSHLAQSQSLDVRSLVMLVASLSLELHVSSPWWCQFGYMVMKSGDLQPRNLACGLITWGVYSVFGFPHCGCSGQERGGKRECCCLSRKLLLPFK